MDEFLTMGPTQRRPLWGWVRVAAGYFDVLIIFSSMAPSHASFLQEFGCYRCEPELAAVTGIL